MHGVQDKETAIEDVLRVYPDALAISRDLLGSVDLHEYIPVGIDPNEPVSFLQATAKNQSDKVPSMPQERKPTASSRLRY